MRATVWTCTTAVQVDDLETVGWKYRVIVSKTGKVAWLPKDRTEIRPGHVIIPEALAQRILGRGRTS